jgi:phosphate transport system permease protein
MKKFREIVAERAFLLSALASSSITVLILAFMIFMGFPIMREGRFFQLLAQPWEPYQGSFGIFPMIVSTGVISLLSLLFAFPLSLGCSFLIGVIGPKPVRKAFRRVIELMTGIPTVIYSFVAIFLLVPIVRELFQKGSGMCILTASLVLAILISPTMTLFFCDSFDRVPRSYLNAADALGASKVQKLAYVIIPSARKGMLNGVILAFGRAVGDTLVSLMLAGNSIQTPGSVLDPARTLTAHIALVIAADYESPEFRSIFACGVVLYLITMLLTFLVRRVSRAEETRH